MIFLLEKALSAADYSKPEASWRLFSQSNALSRDFFFLKAYNLKGNLLAWFYFYFIFLKAHQYVLIRQERVHLRQSFPY